MSGYIPTEEDIAKTVRELEKKDPENANPKYAREMLVRIKLMYREIGRVDEDRLRREMEEFKNKNSSNEQS